MGRNGIVSIGNVKELGPNKVAGTGGTGGSNVAGRGFMVKGAVEAGMWAPQQELQGVADPLLGL